MNEVVNEDEQSEEAEIDEKLPEYGQIEGAKIMLKGLDYSLLNEEKNKNRKKGFMDKIKEKLQGVSLQNIHKEPSKNEKHPKQITFENDQLTRKIMSIQKVKPSINLSTYYIFDSKYNFGTQKPEIITKRFGKMHSQPLFISNSADCLQKFRELLSLDEKYKALKLVEDQVHNDMIAEQSDSDEQIFNYAACSETIQTQEIKTKTSQAKVLNQFYSEINIKIGQKLSFGINDDDIFGKSNYTEFKRKQTVISETPAQPDKYEFMRKKVKPSAAAEIDDGYGECYNQTGPSLDEMRELKKQGIQLFGDQKEFKQKERKIDVNKDYQKVKKIIDEKYKK